MAFRTEDKYFASTRGLVHPAAHHADRAVVQRRPRSTSRRARARRAASRCSRSPRGYEHIEACGMLESAERIGSEAVEHLAAPSVEPGIKDLVLLPSHLALTIHESIGHSTELDRALGYEANFAGTSFLAPPEKMMGKFQFGSPTGERDRRPHAAAGDVDRGLRRRRREGHLAGTSSRTACSRPTRRSATRRIWSARRSRAAAATPTASTASRSSACRTSGSRRGPTAPRSTTSSRRWRTAS